jgi:hypothetical protein
MIATEHAIAHSASFSTKSAGSGLETPDHSVEFRFFKVTEFSPAIMIQNMMSDLLFSSRLTLAVPDEFARAVREAASIRGLTVAAYVRGSLSDRLRAEGVKHPPMPCLHRGPTTTNRRRQ